jgi:hypothetical protein
MLNSNQKLAAVLTMFTAIATAFPTYDRVSERRNVLLEAKGSVFVPTNDTFRHIYHTGGIFDLELTFQIYEGLFGWGSGGVFFKKGHSIGECDPTCAIIVPIGAGLKYLWNFDLGDLYLGAGVLGVDLHTKDGSPFVIPHRHKWGVGGIVKAGFLFDLPRSFFADLFTDYSFAKVHFCCNEFTCGVVSQPANVSGWGLGLGFGYRFE